MKIQITHEHESYFAIDDDTYDGPGSPVGHGLTERAAIEDLCEQIIDLLEARIDRLRYATVKQDNENSIEGSGYMPL